MPKVFTSITQKTGQVGENVAVKHLKKLGYKILERNYTKKWGEIDIVAKKKEILYFIEVKSVVRNNLDKLVLESENYRPEDNMHPWKLKRLSKTIQTYILQNKVSEETQWQVNLMVVYLDMVNKKARIKVVNDIIL